MRNLEDTRASGSNSVKILHIMPRADTRSGGGALAAIKYSEILEKTSFELKTIIYHHKSDGELIKHRLKRSVIKKTFTGSRLRFPLNFYYLLREVARADVIILPGMYLFVNTFAGILSVLLKKKIFLMPYDSFNPEKLTIKSYRKSLYRNFLDHFYIKRASAIHAANLREAQDIRAYFKNYDMKSPEIKIIPYGFDFDELRAVKKQTKKKFSILYFARIDVNKGLINLINAFEFIIKEQPNATLEIAGAEWNKAYSRLCKQAIRRSPYQSRIVWHGEVSNTEKLSLFSSADLYILPSHAENFGITVLEAVLNDCKILISDRVPWDGVENISPYLVYDSQDVEQLAKNAVELLRLDSDQNDLILDGLYKYAKRYSSDVIVGQLADNLTDIYNG